MSEQMIADLMRANARLKSENAELRQAWMEERDVHFKQLDKTMEFRDELIAARAWAARWKRTAKDQYAANKLATEHWNYFLDLYLKFRKLFRLANAAKKAYRDVLREVYH